MLEFRALGPIEVVSGGKPLELGKGGEQALLGVLILAGGSSVATDELVDALWGERPPASAREMVRNYVGRLRTRLGQDAIETTPSGYRLAAPEDAIDIRRFERLSVSGEEALERGDPAQASSDLRDALALWRGRPLPELDDAPAYAPRLRALEELRLRVEEGRIGAELELGRAGALIHELEALHEQQPYRERLLGQLMLALYRSGRQKDALDRYTSARRRLIDEVGLEPGPELRDLQQQILRQDPALAHARPPTRVPEPPSPPAQGPARRRLLLAAPVVAAALVIGGVIAFRSGGGRVRVPRRGVVALRPGSAHTVAAAALPASPGPLAVDAQHVWVASAAGPSVFVLAPRRLARARDVHVPRTPFSLAASGGSVWIGNGFDGTISRINAQDHLAATFRPQPHARGRLPLAAGAGQLWVASQDASLTRLDPTSGRAARTYSGVGYAESIAVGDHAVWIADATSDVVERFDPRAGRVVRRIPVGGRSSAVVVGGGTVWALTPAENELWRIDPKRGAVTQSFSVPSNTTSLTATPSAVWLGTQGGLLVTIDTSVNRIVRTQALGRPIDALANHGGLLWASVG
jgi:DNA-binding SARP family transcriptional activator/streptogramin lyase